VIISRMMIWAGHVAGMENMRNVYNILFVKPEGKRRLGRSRSKWEDNITRDLRKIGWEGVEWVHMAQDMKQWRTLVITVMNLRIS
jgi:hypothetical protein